MKVNCVRYFRDNWPQVQDYETKCNNNALMRIKPAPYSGRHVPAANNTRRQCKYPIYSELQPACVGIINFDAEITHSRDSRALGVIVAHIINIKMQ